LCFFRYSVFLESRGRTIHLLKAGSKKVPQERTRRKISLLGTYEEFKQQTEEQKQEEPGTVSPIPEQNEADQ